MHPSEEVGARMESDGCVREASMHTRCVRHRSPGGKAETQTCKRPWLHIKRESVTQIFKISQLTARSPSITFALNGRPKFAGTSPGVKYYGRGRILSSVDVKWHGF